MLDRRTRIACRPNGSNFGHRPSDYAAKPRHYNLGMPPQSDSAIVLMRLDYSESSQVIVFFTRDHGKVRAIAKGVKRGTKARFAVGVDLLDVGRIVFSSRVDGPALATLTEWKPSRTLFGLRERLARLRSAEYVAEVTGHLTEDHDPHPQLFDALLGTLQALADADDTLPWLVSFQLILLSEVGLLPRFDGCVLCGRESDLTHFSAHQGGLVCRNCEPGQIEKRRVSERTRRALQLATAEVTEDPAAARLSEMPPGGFALLNYHIAHLIGREPRLAASILSPQRQRLVE